MTNDNYKSLTRRTFRLNDNNNNYNTHDPLPNMLKEITNAIEIRNANEIINNIVHIDFINKTIIIKGKRETL